MNITRAKIAQSMAAREYKAQLNTRFEWMGSSKFPSLIERAKIEQEAAALYARIARQAMGLEAR
ncbi:hypothetical protein F406_gp061 [Agrobacterium phage 7-7-1]|uniref:Uncharacterized protein n=1 Tax=Agrobacterium phage 7-7-1 TaxID=1161931 RepID=J7FA66_9CAUD|nr:hypothetical protein F406_gp061 [Agrobacterium phage 7-7-1]AFH19754.1 hypothetical protein 7-7-1_00056 [Agrobacterium phage 7-7-1]